MNQRNSNDTATEYQVKVEKLDAGEYSLIFATRNQARKYKRALAESRQQPKAYIIKREYDNDYIYSELVVS